jgi:DinB superfamily
MDEGPVVRTKQDLIDDTCSAWDDFVTYVDGLTAEQWTGPRDEAGWSVKDHVSHVTLWDRAVIQRLRHNVPLEKTLGISAGAWADESFDPMNEEVRRVALADAVDRVCADRDATWIDVVSLLEDLSEEQLARSGAAAGLAVGVGLLSGSVLTVLASYWGEHYREHLEVIKLIVADEQATEFR